MSDKLCSKCGRRLPIYDKPCAELCEACEQRAWMPIESAPKNATDILVWTTINGIPGALVAHFADGGGEDQPRFKGWFAASSYGFLALASLPTHWCPIPAPPGGTS